MNFYALQHIPQTKTLYQDFEDPNPVISLINLDMVVSISQLKELRWADKPPLLYAEIRMFNGASFYLTPSDHLKLLKVLEPLVKQ